MFPRFWIIFFLFSVTLLGEDRLVAQTGKITPGAKVLPLPGTAFQLDGRDAFVILPPESKRDSGNDLPWVWYAPTLTGLPADSEVWMFQQFLDEGIAIAGIDVGESFGNAEGAQRYQDFYQHLIKARGFGPKPCLLARSRGGLMLYNWAVERADCVGGVAGIYPVCNLASYPGMKVAAGAYGLSEQDLQRDLDQHNPISRIEPLAKANVPVFHIHGDSDKVVPLEANSAELAKRYNAFGGRATIEVVKGQGHNMWDGWFKSQKLTDFVIASAKGPSAKPPSTKEQPQPSDLGSTIEPPSLLKLKDEVDQVVRSAIAKGQMPGAVVTIGHKGKLIHRSAYGHRQIEPQPIEMTLDTVFDLASLTKPIATATCMMKLIEDGKVGLEDPVAKHLPEFGVHGKEHVTIKQLMIHIGGLIPDNPMSDYGDGKQKSIENFLSVSLNYPPGTKFRYSDVGFEVLGVLIERKTGKDLRDFSQQILFQPLGMKETDFLPCPELKRRAAVTEKRDGIWMQGEVHDPRAFAMGGVAGHAGLFSTAADLSRYARMMLNHGQLDGQSILRPETVKMMTAPYAVPGGSRGLGWDKQTGYSSNRGASMSPSAYGHGGFTGTAIWIDPTLDLFVIFLSSRLHPDGKGSVNRVAGKIGTIAADAVVGSKRE